MDAADVDGGASSSSSAASFITFRSLVESADRKFARVSDLPPYSRAPHLLHYYSKVFRAYTRLWRFQQDRRRDLVAGGLRRWEIGEIASRIGQLYYGQYLRTSEARFLLEAYVFYEAILSRGYFEAAEGSSRPDLGLRFKELRFHARFLIVALLLNRKDVARNLADRFKILVRDSTTNFPENNFKEWKLVLQEILKFLKVDTAFTTTRPSRYSVLFDSHPSSIPSIARFHANRMLRLQDALLASYHRNEVKLTELTLDTYRMLQCLEWEPSGSFYQLPARETSDNGPSNDQSATSGLIDINLAADMTDPTLPPNPRKAILYRPSVSHLISVLATICEELSSENILLIYISASGKAEQNVALQKDNSENALNSLKLNHASQGRHKRDSSLHQPPVFDRSNSSESFGSYLWLGSRGSGGQNLYPEDLIPFTRRPLFLIIDSDNSHTFKAIHGSERGEKAALLLSPVRPSSLSATDLTPNGSQFTHFLTAPLVAFCQLVGLSSDMDSDVRINAESVLSSALAEWEEILCTTDCLNQVWAQVLCDPFLRRLILRFIFCRAVLSLFSPYRKATQYLPECLPNLPESVSPNSSSTQSYILRLAQSLGAVGHFHFPEGLKSSVHCR